MQNYLPIETTLITGALGSGKTTLINHLVGQTNFGDTLVLVNEFGEIGLDHLLVEQPRDNVKILANGCLCCTISGELIETLSDLAEQRCSGQLPPFRRMFIETSGLANPVPILQTLLNDLSIVTSYKLQSVITTVDAVNYQLQEHEPNQTVSQIEAADNVLITKADLLSNVEIHLLKEKITRLNPSVDIHVIYNGVLADCIDRLFIGINSERISRVENWLKKKSKSQSSQHLRLHGADELEEANTHSFCFNQQITYEGLQLWMNMISLFKSDRILRIKGLLNINNNPIVLHAIHHLFHPVDHLNHWPDSERNSRLVFITKNISREEIERTLPTLSFRIEASDTNLINIKNYMDFQTLAIKFD